VGEVVSSIAQRKLRTPAEISRREKQNVCYYAARILPDLADLIKKDYPGLDVTAMSDLDERFYGPLRDLLERYISELK
jgi:hypothetical protein